MSRWARRIGLQALLWAAPLGVGLALVALLLAAPYFRSGPDVPSAGDARAWGAMWGALVFVAAGSVVGLVATSAWLARAWRRRHRPSRLEWVRSAANLLVAAAFLWVWFH
jgi:hypothetical protein